MLRLGDTSLIPPGGWRYTQMLPDGTTVHLTGHSYDQLISRVELLRAGNGLDLSTGWRERIEAEICEQCQLGPKRCTYEAPPVYAPKRLTLHDIMVFLAVVKSWVSTGREWVSQEEANRRAAICAACPNNVVIEGCTSCSRLVEKITEVIGNRSTPYDGMLNGCQVCGCAGKVHVHLPIQVLARGVNENQDYPRDFCWKVAAVDMVRQERLDREKYADME